MNSKGYRIVKLSAVVLAGLVCFGQAMFAQVVQVTPTNYSITIESQNNMGKWFTSWVPESRDTIVLSGRILTFTHTVFTPNVYWSGSRVGAPKKLENSYSYRQIGAASYYPIGGTEIVYWASKPAGGWIAGTNYVLASDMEPMFWLPTIVGNVTIGDSYHRVVTTGSPLVCYGRSIASSPYLMRYRCTTINATTIFAIRFEPSERKLFTLDLPSLNSINNDSFSNFFVDLDNWDEQQLQW